MKGGGYELLCRWKQYGLHPYNRHFASHTFFNCYFNIPNKYINKYVIPLLGMSFAGFALGWFGIVGGIVAMCTGQ